MLKNKLYVLAIMTCLFGSAQQCPIISSPSNGSTDIPVDATITWPAVDDINGYVISLGITPGGKEIINSQSIGLDTSYTAPVGLPENTKIYITLSLIPFDSPPILCSNTSFTTVNVTSPPPCTILIAPDNKAGNVTIVTDLVWAYASTATGYRLSMGTMPNGTDLVNNVNVGNVLEYDPIDNLPQGINIYVTITPYNENGDSGICIEENFSTGAEAFDCDSLIDEITGEVIHLKPQIDFPNTIGFCVDESPYTITSSDIADGFRWFRTNEGSAETLLSQNKNLALTEPGRYRYEAYNNITVDGNIIECSDFKLFNVVTSGKASIETIGVENLEGGRKITIIASGKGQYEYALDDANGPYQDSSVFENIPPGPHTAFVRDKNGCGISQRTVDRNLNLNDFPKFFTPNTDGINDFWQYNPPPENYDVTIAQIVIFDRYGNFLLQLDPKALGWDGNFKGKPLPASDYWFKAVFDNQQEVRGHFSLKR